MMLKNLEQFLMEAVKEFHPQCDVADLVFKKKLDTDDNYHVDNVINLQN